MLPEFTLSNPTTFNYPSTLINSKESKSLSKSILISDPSTLKSKKEWTPIYDIKGSPSFLNLLNPLYLKPKTTDFSPSGNSTN